MCVLERPDSLLRPSVPGDAAALSRLRSDLELQHLLMANPEHDLPVDPVTEAAAWITRREGAGWFRVIDAGHGGVGFVQISDIHHKNRFGWLGIALLPAERCKGLGFRALAEAEALSTRELGLRKLLLQVRADNVAASTLYRRSGWRHVGEMLAHYDDGRRLHDVAVHEKVLV